MVDLSCLLWIFIALFAYIGYGRGWGKELISLASIVLALFALNQFDTLIRFSLFGALPADQIFWVQVILFLAIVFFGYQSRAIDRIGGRVARGGRDQVQTSILGALVGAVNGYLVFGSIWSFLDINSYPLSPFVTQPVAGTPSGDTIGSLPLYVLAQGSPGEGSLLTLIVIILFVFVLIVI